MEKSPELVRAARIIVEAHGTKDQKARSRQRLDEIPEVLAVTRALRTLAKDEEGARALVASLRSWSRQNEQSDRL